MENLKTETKIISWNVNGIRARLDAVKALVEKEQPDILCLQEIKVKDSRPYLEAIPGYVGIANTNATSPGHAGVAIYTRDGLLGDVDSGHILADRDGRILGMVIAGKRIVSAYIPADRRKKIGMLGNLAGWLGNCSCVVCGDFNTVSTDIDYHCFIDGRENCLPLDKAMMASFKDTLHLKDPYRDLYPLSRAYTYWPYTDWCRERDIGMRIDYTLVSENVSVVGAEILGGVMGSDHCPVSVTVCLNNNKGREENG